MTAGVLDLHGIVAAIAPAIAYVVLAVIAVHNGIYLMQLAVAAVALGRRQPTASAIEDWWRYGDATLPVSVLTPAYNEEATIVESVRSLLSLHYPEVRVIVVNDGSTDATLETLAEAFALEPVERAFETAVPHQPIRGLYASPLQHRLLVVDKENGGKADAVNAGINVCRTPLFCTVDADSLLDADALLRVSKPFVDDPDLVVAVGGTICVANGCRVRSGRVMSIALPDSLLAMFQVVEYMRAFTIGRIAWSSMNALMLISGAFGLFRRSTVVAIGGYRSDAIGEDLELIVEMHARLREQGRDYAVVFVPEPICWTQVPETLGPLAGQRRRWQRGALQTFFRHAKMLANPRYGSAGLVGISQIFIIDVATPLIEVLGYVMMPVFWAMDAIAWDLIAAYIGLTFVFGIFLSIGALVLDTVGLGRRTKIKSLLVLAGAAMLENFGYRQLNNIWRILGWWDFLRGKRSWGVMPRTGFKPS